ncbi:MAG: pyruvate dehydrogenase (acetyl-transferring), homodimeric type [Thermoleophilia bacterium]|nr:pyruvate dehydrogenase (acetyl-transferring), homodimeric type [Thermoleophilia bacterium]MDH3725529.1 pyruvate dehydrogenase (acetyl-transferring), homodimeric type [Thermoleophilia bacterium]
MGAAVTEVRVPPLRAFRGVPVIDVLVGAGDTVAPGDPLVTLEAGKASMNVRCPLGGTVEAVAVAVGDTVSPDSPIVTLGHAFPPVREKPTVVSKEIPDGGHADTRVAEPREGADTSKEWREAIETLIARDEPRSPGTLIARVADRGNGRAAAASPPGRPTPYVNTIHVDDQPPYPGDLDLERRIRSLARWNAMAMVLRANRHSTELGGHIASYQSAATLFEVGFNHFWHAASEEHDGDLVYLQGHSSPGVYARAFLEGRLTEAQLDGFRQEVSADGLSSYPHPWLMPDFWQFSTVSMGLGPIMGIYQARFMRYLTDRGITDTSGRKVWVLLGDGETDEPEALGGLSLAGRQHLDNLIFVVNCNLQRLDGPVRGNGKIIQELETVFRGAGWNVIKVIWGSRWDPLLAADHDGLLMRRMEEVLDGEYQVFPTRDGAFVRERFFGHYPELKRRVSGMSDAEIWRLNRGGLDPLKVHAAYQAAVRHKGQPTVILAKTVKGFGMGRSGEALNITHHQKHMDVDDLKAFRDRFHLDISDEDLERASYRRPADDSPEMRYLKQRRAALGGPLPARRGKVGAPLPVPGLELFERELQGTGDHEISTTMAFVRLLTTLMRHEPIGDRVVPIVPDESRTFGMEGMFREFGIYSHVGQLYESVDAQELAPYREDRCGQMLEEGINEAGAISGWIAAGTAYSNHATQMIPFYVFYSMFGFQRTGDLAWAAGDNRTRGFLIGATAGRTTLNGEGLQHQDGQSHLLSAPIPNCVSYDPAYAYEIAVIVQDGLRRMIAEQEDVYYYITVENENYAHPPMPQGAEEGILRGLHPVRRPAAARAQLLGAGPILGEVLAAAELLRDDFGIDADVWSATSFTELARDGMSTDRWNMLHPGHERRSWVERCLTADRGPVVAACDYVKALPYGISKWVPGTYLALGTDGFGRSDWRKDLRRFFEVDRYQVAVATLSSLAHDGEIAPERVAEAIARYDIDPDARDPVEI